MGGNGTQFRQLAISDLLLLIFAVGVSFAFVASEINRIWQLPDETFVGQSRIPVVAFAALDYLSIGIKLFGFAVILRERLRAKAANLSPGHWYFLAAGPLAAYILLRELPPMSRRPAIDNASWAAFSLVGSVVSGIAIYATKSWRWRIVCGFLVAALASFFFLNAYRAAEIYGYAGYRYRLHAIALWGSLVIAAAAAALVAAIVDVASRTNRDWLHWLAIIALSLDATTCAQAFGEIISRCWQDCFAHVFG
jgi:hypothetical protein